ncbi:hypothetical protein N7527_002003 [Penicillium freii]|nr:hypothetical protein N7527_002003 [Penicillium freii]
MPVPQYTSGQPYYAKMDSITDTTITYRMLYLEPNLGKIWPSTSKLPTPQAPSGLPREVREQKGRGYDLSFGSTYTYTFPLPPVDNGLGVPLPSKDSDDAYVSGHTEKVCLEG